MPTRAHVLTGPLEHVASAYRAAASPDDPARSETETGPDLTSLIRAVLGDSKDALHLQEAVARLARTPELEAAVALVLEDAMALTGADLGYLQVVEPTSATSRIVAYAGFDTDDDADSALHGAIAEASGAREIHTTAMTGADGNHVGTVGLRLPDSGALPEDAVTLGGIYLRFAGEVLARSLRKPSTTPPAPLPADFAELTDMIVRSVFSAGLNLAGARELIGDGAAGEQVAAAVSELDRILGALRTAVAGFDGSGAR